MPAEITCARRDTVRVEPSILVERDEVRSVRGAKDMTTVTAVVSTQEETERGAAGGGVAIGRCFVGLWKLATVCLSTAGLRELKKNSPSSDPW